MEEQDWPLPSKKERNMKATNEKAKDKLNDWLLISL